MARDDDSPSDESIADLLPIVRRALSDGQPLAVLGLASATLAVILHPAPPLDVERELIRNRVIEDLVGRYVDIGTSESLAYAAALTGLLADESLRRTLRGALDGAESEIPGWLAQLDGARLEQTTVVRDLFDGDEWLLAGVALADGSRFAFRVEIDHDADSALTDAAMLPTTVDDVTQRLIATATQDEVTVTEISADEFWGRYTEALAVAETNGDPARTETWPSCRPLIEWALGTTPTGPRSDRRTGR